MIDLILLSKLIILIRSCFQDNMIKRYNSEIKLHKSINQLVYIKNSILYLRILQASKQWDVLHRNKIKLPQAISTHRIHQKPVQQNEYQTLNTPKQEANQFTQTDPIHQYYTLVPLEEKSIEINKLVSYIKKGMSASNNQVRFIKTFHSHNFSQNDREEFSKNIEHLQKLVHIHNLQESHLNICETKQYYFHDDQLHLTYEFIEGGTLLYNLSRIQTVQQQELINIFLQVVAGIHYLHQNHIIHGDLKLSHILLESSHSKVVKLIDFGITSHFKQIGSDWKQKQISSEFYFKAPEQFKGNQQRASDVWACGCLLYFLITSHMPFQGLDVNRLKQSIQRGQVDFNPHEWRGVSQQIIDMIKKMLSGQPSQRPTAKEVLNSPIFSDKLHQKRHSNISITRNFQTFKETSEAQLAALQYMVDNMVSDNAKQKLLEEFKSIDVDNDGMISQEELLAVYKSRKSSIDAVEEVQQLFEKVDTNRNGFIDYNEFLLASVNLKKMLNVDKLKKLFNQLDKDHSGTLSKREILQLFRDLKLSKDKQAQIFRQIDINGDGEVTLEEFFAIMQQI
ncbi:hypothetical protein pb186bvf_002218 [Paramecium bursaria]